MKRLILVMFLLAVSGPSMVWADVSVAPNQAKLEINGAVCAYCAYGMQKALSKMECVDRSQGHKGVESDIENQIITIHLKSGGKLDLQEMSRRIRKGGYEPRVFHVRAKGRAVTEGGRRFLVAANNEKIYELTGDAAGQLKADTTYELQLRVDEEAIKALPQTNLPVAQVNTVIEEE